MSKVYLAVDLGAGDGAMSVRLAELGFDVDAVDLDLPQHVNSGLDHPRINTACPCAHSISRYGGPQSGALPESSSKVIWVLPVPSAFIVCMYER